MDTGVSQVTFDPAVASGISSAQVGTATINVGLQIDGATGQTGTPVVDSSEFLVEQSGPVKTVIRARPYYRYQRSRL